MDLSDYSSSEEEGSIDDNILNNFSKTKFEPSCSSFTIERSGHLERNINLIIKENQYTFSSSHSFYLLSDEEANYLYKSRLVGKLLTILERNMIINEDEDKIWNLIDPKKVPNILELISADIIASILRDRVEDNVKRSLSCIKTTDEDLDEFYIFRKMEKLIGKELMTILNEYEQHWLTTFGSYTDVVLPSDNNFDSVIRKNVNHNMRRIVEGSRHHPLTTSSSCHSISSTLQAIDQSMKKTVKGRRHWMIKNQLGTSKHFEEKILAFIREKKSNDPWIISALEEIEKKFQRSLNELKEKKMSSTNNAETTTTTRRYPTSSGGGGGGDSLFFTHAIILLEHLLAFIKR